MKTKESSRKITTDDGAEIHYWLNHPASGNGVVKFLYPGSSMNHSSLEPIERMLFERGYSTLLLEPRGIGYSLPLDQSKQRADLETFSGDIEKILKKEGIERPSFLTHSFGFMPVVDYVARTSNAKNIEGVCVSPDFRLTTLRGVAKLFSSLVQYLDRTGGVINQALDLFSGKEREYNDMSDLEGLSDFEIWLRINRVPFNEIRSRKKFQKALDYWNVCGQLKSVGESNIPIHTIYGNNDLMVMPRLAIPLIKELTGNTATTEIIPGTHSLPYTKPKEVLEALAKYD